MAGADVNTSFFLIGFYFVVSRMGMSFTNPFIMSALRTLPAGTTGAGGGMVNFCRQFGGSMGLTAWVFVQYRTQHHGDALTVTQFDNSTTRELMESVGRVLSEEDSLEIIFGRFTFSRRGHSCAGQHISPPGRVPTAGRLLPLRDDTVSAGSNKENKGAVKI